MTFNKDEIYTATDVVRNFSTMLDKVDKEGKIVILKNNKFQAVMLSMNEYERLINAVNLLELIHSKQKV
ncbi:putative toxin-antitoxin system, antitoxin component, Phd/YefM family [Campylobacter avium LMG 24591]|uniref:Antitoxin n=1 Tax=Campylobacter avium LMG 24591 TaxID=522484 RepID=A0A222MXH3_9BACT|nr:type II toxin-antitoxin system Phd/YefM family antitoxin [Campylobacter avium]ASQ30605.1 putative toxin-antitoxin system, antitoxin component, Phd/YefM family [Campylobacter avium LMG 24591]OYD79701.1 putative toxin-antitoxin system, antitoxin component, Phd/YefM family [Campylobacter avium]HJE65521.1 type II toxin-antitoxin system Phd/YefM family antitoxin [Campylobacter avium]